MLLDINFNFGEFYPNEDSRFAIFIAIFSVILTTVVQRLYDNYKTNASLDTLFDYVNEESIKLGKNAVLQSDQLILLCKSIKKVEIRDFVLTKISAFDIDLITEWNSLQFYESIVKRFECDDEKTLLGSYSKIKSTIKFAKEVKELIHYDYSEFLRQYMKIQDSWKEHVKTIPSLLTQYKLEFEQHNIEPNEFLISFHEIITEWSSLKIPNKAEMSVVYNNVVLKLIPVCNKFSNDSRAIELLNQVNYLRVDYNEIQSLKKRYRRQFILSARKLINIKIALQSEFAELRKYKRRSKFLS